MSLTQAVEEAEKAEFGELPEKTTARVSAVESEGLDALLGPLKQQITDLQALFEKQAMGSREDTNKQYPPRQPRYSNQPRYVRPPYNGSNRQRFDPPQRFPPLQQRRGNINEKGLASTVVVLATGQKECPSQRVNNVESNDLEPDQYAEMYLSQPEERYGNSRN